MVMDSKLTKMKQAYSLSLIHLTLPQNSVFVFSLTLILLSKLRALNSHVSVKLKFLSGNLFHGQTEQLN